MRADEIPVLLQVGGDATLIAFSMISELCIASTKGNSEIRLELLNLVRASLISAMIKATDTLCRIESPVVAHVAKAAHAFVQLCCFDVLPRDFALMKPTLVELQTLCQAVANLLCSCVSQQPGAQDRVDMDFMSAACDIWAKLRFICSHPSLPGVDYDGFTFIYQPFNSLSVILGLMTVTRLHPRTALCQRVCSILVNFTNYESFNELLMHPCRGTQCGVEMVIDAVSSLSHDDNCLASLLNALSNFSQTGNVHSYYMAKKQALDFLQPCVLHSNEKIARCACQCISILACNPDLANNVEKSDVLPVVESFWRSRIPGKHSDSSTYDVNDVPIMLKMLSKDSHSALQLTCLHSIVANLNQEGNKKLFGHQQFISLYRSCAHSRDAFVYMAAVAILREYELAVPNFTLGKADAGPIPALSNFVLLQVAPNSLSSNPCDSCLQPSKSPMCLSQNGALIMCARGWGRRASEHTNTSSEKG